MEESDIRRQLEARQYGEAFGLLLERFKEKVFRLAFSILRDETQAEDAAQDVFRAKSGRRFPPITAAPPFPPGFMPSPAIPVSRNSHAAAGIPRCPCKNRKWRPPPTASRRFSQRTRNPDRRWTWNSFWRNCRKITGR